MAEKQAKSLKAFMREEFLRREPVKYAASSRLTDESGAPIEWELRVLTNDEVEAILDRHTRRVPIKGTRQYQKETDTEAVFMDMALASVVFPNLNDGDLQAFYSAVGAEHLLKKILTPGELTDLLLAVQQACDYDTGMGEKIKTVKNS